MLLAVKLVRAINVGTRAVGEKTERSRLQRTTGAPFASAGVAVMSVCAVSRGGGSRRARKQVVAAAVYEVGNTIR